MKTLKRNQQVRTNILSLIFALDIILNKTFVLVLDANLFTNKKENVGEG